MTFRPFWKAYPWLEREDVLACIEFMLHTNDSARGIR
jgi:uncharacterized protein (DUF433 family)